MKKKKTCHVGMGMTGMVMGMVMGTNTCTLICTHSTPTCIPAR